MNHSVLRKEILGKNWEDIEQKIFLRSTYQDTEALYIGGGIGQVEGFKALTIALVADRRL